MRQRRARPRRLPADGNGLDGDLKFTFLAPHVRIAGGVRAILSYADRLAGRGHAVTVVVPGPGLRRALWRRVRGVRPSWMPGLRARIAWVPRWHARALPDADVLVATGWQSAPVVAAAPARCGERFYASIWSSTTRASTTARRPRWTPPTGCRCAWSSSRRGSPR